MIRLCNPMYRVCLAIYNWIFTMFMTQLSAWTLVVVMPRQGRDADWECHEMSKKWYFTDITDPVYRHDWRDFVLKCVFTLTLSCHGQSQLKDLQSLLFIVLTTPAPGYFFTTTRCRCCWLQNIFQNFQQQCFGILFVHKCKNGMTDRKDVCRKI